MIGRRGISKIPKKEIYGKEGYAVIARFLINIVSLMHIGKQRTSFPGSIFASPQELIDIAKAIGYDGVQALPIRGLDGSENGILLYEDAWNAVPNLWHALRHKPGAANMPSQVQDWVVSPSPTVCFEISDRLEKRGVTKVVHQLDRNPQHIVELNKEIDLPPGEIRRLCNESGQQICLDTMHLGEYADANRDRYEVTFTATPAMRAEAEAIRLLGPLTSTIHVHAAEPSEFVRWQGSEKYRVLSVLGTLFNKEGTLSLVAEYPPTPRRMLSRNQTVNIASEYLSAMKAIVADAI